MKAEGENKGDRGLSKERCIDWSDSSQASDGTSPAQPAPVGSKPAPCQDAPGGGEDPWAPPEILSWRPSSLWCPPVPLAASGEWSLPA